MNVPPGSFRLLILASESGARGQYVMPINLTKSSFNKGTWAITCDQEDITIPQGGSRTQRCGVQSHGGLNSPVRLWCESRDGIACSISPSEVTPVAYGPPTPVTLSINMPKNLERGQYTLFLKGKNQAWSFPDDVGRLIQVHVPGRDFNFSCDTNAFTTQGNDGSTNCTVTSINEFEDQVTFSCSPSSTFTCALDPPQVNLASGASATTTLHVNTEGMAPGSYTVRVEARSPPSNWQVYRRFDITVLVP